MYNFISVFFYLSRSVRHVSLICDKIVTTQNLAFFEKETFTDALLTGIES